MPKKPNGWAVNWAEWFSVPDAEDQPLGRSSDAVRQHLIERMRDRAISLSDLNQLRQWMGTNPEVPEGDWYKTSDRLSFAVVGSWLRRSYCEGMSRKARNWHSPCHALPASRKICYLLSQHVFP